MKSKKLLALIIVLAVLVVVIVVFASVFTVRKVTPIYHNFDGGEIQGEEGYPSENDVLKFCKGKNILFMSKSKLLDKLNEAFPEWHAIGVVKMFPNKLAVHFVKSVAVVKLGVGDGVYLDCFGYVVPAPQDGSVPIDITSAIALPSTPKVNELGRKFEFVNDESNRNLECVIQGIMALWQCNCDINQIPEVFGKSDVFFFNADGDMIIVTKANAQLVIKSPKPNDDLTKRLIKAFSVYCNPDKDLQHEGVVITVGADGHISSK